MKRRPSRSCEGFRGNSGNSLNDEDDTLLAHKNEGSKIFPGNDKSKMLRELRVCESLDQYWPPSPPLIPPRTSSLTPELSREIQEKIPAVPPRPNQSNHIKQSTNANKSFCLPEAKFQSVELEKIRQQFDKSNGAQNYGIGIEYYENFANGKYLPKRSRSHDSLLNLHNIDDPLIQTFERNSPGKTYFNDLPPVKPARHKGTNCRSKSKDERSSTKKDSIAYSTATHACSKKQGLGMVFVNSSLKNY